jgi:pimeloyl-ACP methyl ester carboxylesterase
MTTMHSMRLVVLGGIGAAALLLGAVPQAAAQATDGSLRPCRLNGVPHEVRCGHVLRPLDPSRPEGPRIEVHYAVVPAVARHKLADPVVLLAGGPGQSAIDVAGATLPLFTRLNQRRDLVFVDQRGTGRSAPLRCASDDAAPLADRLDVGRSLRRLARCREQLAALPHGDLRHYTTPRAMEDLEAVRVALGAPQLNLVGASYGTRAALEYLRQQPQRVRRAVIDGVAPPDMVLPDSLAADAQAVLDRLFEACAREPACAAQRPHLAARWRELLAGLPKPVEATDPVSGDRVSVMLTRHAVAAAVRGPLYAPALAAGLPYAIGEALRGRHTPLLGLASGLGVPRAAGVAEGMHFSVVCAEDAPRMAPAGGLPASDFGDAFGAPYREACRDWPRLPLPEAFYAVPVSPAPVLAFSGGLDPVTPPRHGERVVQALGPKARHVTVAHAGHGVIALGCARDVLQRFVEAESEAEALRVDARCLNDVPRPPAFEPPRASVADPA